MNTNAGRIDVHHHILPRLYVDALAKAGHLGGGGMPFPAWDPENTLAMMDRQGIATGVTSISAPGIPLRRSRPRAARAPLQQASAIVADHRPLQRVRDPALPDVKGALRELERSTC
jgi:hypothetical protein